MLNFAKLRTPPGDGDTLIEPPLEAWPALLDQNSKNICDSASDLAGVSVRELRRLTRAALGVADGRPVIAAGHQPAFVHPGVWAKHVVVRHAAERYGAGAFDLVVDNDAPHNGGLRLPVLDADGHARIESVDIYPGLPGSPYEGRPAITPERTQELRTTLAGLLRDGFETSMMPRYLAGIERAPSPDSNSVEQHLSGRALIDSSLEAGLPEFRVSRVFGGPFLADLLLNAGRFGSAYNAALAEYRTREGVRSSHRPLPDLARDGERIETALWIYQPQDRRRRLWVEPLRDTIRCYADGTVAGEVSKGQLQREPYNAIEALEPFVIRPRALTLTLWARLLAADLFVHGIGGAKYDRITDHIFASYYGCKPPAIAAVTATLRLPLPLFPVTRADVAAARHEVRDLRFNPPRYIRDIRPDLLRRKTGLIKESIDFREDQAPTLVRREVWQAIRTLNEALLAIDPRVMPELSRRAERLERELASNAVAGSREYFYALQPRARLEMLAERLRGRAGAIQAR